MITGLSRGIRGVRRRVQDARQVLAAPSQAAKPDFYMRDNPEYSNYQIGRGTYGSPSVPSWGEEATLKIGAFCAIAAGVVIFLGGEHRSDWVTTYPFSALWPSAANIKGHPGTKGTVTIGNDVWIGYGVTILSGVTVGDGAVLGAHCVVAQDVRPYEIVAGNPAKHIRFRFSPETIAALEKIAWWNWPDQQIEEALPLLLSGDVPAFIAKYG